MKYVNKSRQIHQRVYIIDFALSKKEQFSEEDVAGKFDNEILEWVGRWEDLNNDWYIDHSNEEAQDVVISELISWYEEHI
jgi:3-oxoacyl-ACP reductase-like protein